MSKLSGIKIIRDSKGRPRQLVFDVKKHYRVLEDIIDNLIADMRADEPTVPLEKVKKEMEQLHGLKFGK